MSHPLPPDVERRVMAFIAFGQRDPRQALLGLLGRPTLDYTPAEINVFWARADAAAALYTLASVRSPHGGA